MELPGPRGAAKTHGGKKGALRGHWSPGELEEESTQSGGCGVQVSRMGPLGRAPVRPAQRPGHREAIQAAVSSCHHQVSEGMIHTVGQLLAGCSLKYP